MIDLTEFLVPEVHAIEQDLQIRAKELSIAYDDPETFEKDRGVKVADLEATFQEKKAERDRLLGIVLPPEPTIDEEAAARAELLIREAKIEAKTAKIIEAVTDEDGNLRADHFERVERFKADGGLDE